MKEINTTNLRRPLAGKPLVLLALGVLSILAAGFYGAGDKAPQRQTASDGETTPEPLPVAFNEPQRPATQLAAHSGQIPPGFGLPRTPAFQTRAQGVHQGLHSAFIGLPPASVPITPTDMPRTIPSPIYPSAQAHAEQRLAKAAGTLLEPGNSNRPQAGAFEKNEPMAQASGTQLTSGEALTPPISAPMPGGTNNVDLEIAWRLLAQSALHDTNSAALLIQHARRDLIPNEAWSAIAATLLSEDLDEREILVSVKPETLAKESLEELSLRLDLLEALLAVTQNTVARQSLRDAVAWFSGQLNA